MRAIYFEEIFGQAHLGGEHIRTLGHMTLRAKLTSSLSFHFADANHVATGCVLLAEPMSAEAAVFIPMRL